MTSFYYVAHMFVFLWYLFQNLLSCLPSPGWKNSLIHPAGTNVTKITSREIYMAPREKSTYKYIIMIQPQGSQHVVWKTSRFIFWPDLLGTLWILWLYTCTEKKIKACPRNIKSELFDGMEEHHSKIQIGDLHFPYLAKNLRKIIQASKLSYNGSRKEGKHVAHMEICFGTFKTSLRKTIQRDLHYPKLYCSLKPKNYSNCHHNSNGMSSLN